MQNKLRLFFVLVYTACFAVMIVFNVFATRPDGKLFHNATGDVANKYTTYITPVGWTFAIWGVIYIWLFLILVYMYATFCRSNGTKGVYEEAAVTHPFFLVCMSANFLFNAAWLVLWDRELIHAAAGALWALTICSLAASTFNYVKLYKQGFDLNLYKPSELWLNRVIVQNGLEVYVTWTLIAAVINTVVAIQYPPQGYSAPDIRGSVMICIIALAILAGMFVVWFPFEITVFDKYCRYAVTQYAVIPFAMAGIYARKNSINVPELEYLVLAFGIAGLVMLAIKLFLLAYRSKHNPLFPQIRG